MEDSMAGGSAQKQAPPKIEEQVNRNSIKQNNPFFSELDDVLA